MASSLESFHKAHTNSTIVPCDGFRNVNTEGLSGTICGALISPHLVNISSCCDGEVRVSDLNCSQHCSTINNNFGDCINDLWNGTFVTTTCDSSDGSEDGSSTSSSTGSPSGSTGAVSSIGAGGYAVFLLAGFSIFYDALLVL
ncbi:hypothetical protein Q7P37_006693 [Cladosporium fusiforme]